MFLSVCHELQPLVERAVPPAVLQLCPQLGVRERGEEDFP